MIVEVKCDVSAVRRPLVGAELAIQTRVAGAGNDADGWLSDLGCLHLFLALEIPKPEVTFL